MVDTYCENEDVETRIQLGDHYAGDVETIKYLRERAHRWIRQEFRAQGKVDELPDASQELPPDFEILKDIEATRAAYFYKSDLMEWNADPNSRQVEKLKGWEERSEEMLKRLIKTKWGDEFYSFGDR